MDSVKESQPAVTRWGDKYIKPSIRKPKKTMVRNLAWSSKVQGVVGHHWT